MRPSRRSPGDRLRGHLPAVPSCGRLIVPNHGLVRSNTMRIAAQAEWFAAPSDVESLVRVLDEVGGTLPVRVLGGGSNLVLARSLIPGLVLYTGHLRGLRIEGHRIIVGAGYLLPSLIAQSVRRSLGGLEVLAGIPGTVGGAVAQNAGGRWGEIGSRVREVLLVHPDGRLERRSEIPFRYRHSGLKGLVIAEVTLELDPVADARALRDRYRAILADKAKSQPLDRHSAGCVFKNPSGQVAAARLIDQAGWKGRTRGGAEVSPVHANFVVNRGGASPDEVTGLIAEIEADIAQRCGVWLEREVEYW